MTLESALKRGLSRIGVGLHRASVSINRRRTVGGLEYSTVVPHATYSPWLGDSEFAEVYQAISGHHLVDQYRCFELWDLVGQLTDVPGDILEVGVWRGGTGALIAARAQVAASTKTVFLCDTFTGVVKASAKDTSYSGGEHADTTKKVVESLVSRLKLNNVRILQGIFPDDFATEMQNASFSFVHIDVDVYQSAKDVLSNVWPRLAPGGAVVFDDYGFDTCDGIAKLVAEYRGDSDKLIIHNLNGHAILIKT